MFFLHWLVFKLLVLLMNSVSLIINKILDLQNWNSCLSLHQMEQNEIRVANSVAVILHAAFASISNINAHVHAAAL